MKNNLMLGTVLSLSLLSASAFAQEVVREDYKLDLCRPGSVDGTQVFVSSYLDGECVGKPKVILYVADYTLKALCSTYDLKCIKVDAMTAAQRQYYDHLGQYRKSIAEPKVCTQRHGDLRRFEMITSKASLCTPHINGARSYDSITNQGCVYLGVKNIGCVALDK